MPNCTVKVRNESSPIAIRAVRVRFRMADGSTREESKAGLNITQGSSVSIQSGAAGCVKGTTTTVTVGQTQLPPKVSGQGDPCIIRVTWGLTGVGMRTFAAPTTDVATAEAELVLEELASAAEDN